MANGIGVLVGVNQVKMRFHGGRRMRLRGCEKRVERINAILLSLNYDVVTLKTDEATCANVRAKLSAAIKSLSIGDILVFYYIGHSGSVRDACGDGEGDEPIDETLVLSDGEFVDDELSKIFSLAPAGTRVFAITDCCNASGVLDLLRRPSLSRPICVEGDQPSAAFKADIIHYGATGEEKIAFSGRFTDALLNVWDEGRFCGTYETLFNKTKEAFRENRWQKPEYRKSVCPRSTFEGSAPFVI